MPPTPYQELNEVLDRLVSGMQQILAHNLIGAYLQGSFALGDFDEHSDVDWVVVIQDDLTSDQVDALQGLHGRVYDLDSEWAKHLEGSYFPAEILRDPARRGLALWYLERGAWASSSSIQNWREGSTRENHCRQARKKVSSAPRRLPPPRGCSNMPGVLSGQRNWATTCGPWAKNRDSGG